MEIIILSHKRAKEITSHNVVSGSKVCIPVSQKEDYLKYNPDLDIVTHPDSVVGVSAKRQWIYKKFKNVFMLDDDITAVKRTYTQAGSEKEPISPDQARGLILDTYHNAKEAGAKLFGFSRQPNPMYFNSFKPIIFSDFIQGCALGLIEDKNLYFPEIDKMTGEDEFIALLNAHFNRFAWIDKRFFFQFKTTNYNVGGCEEIRNSQTVKESFLHLKKCFGSCVFLDNKKNEGDIIRWKMKIPF